ncbi:hypothetical protein Scep_014523 [Stephania cephalantha]|uniref:Uncharacterized protein n=1 Tax=Stephania cephalantha TaxID=152367 RepID=A0AAP0NZG8_9MAGN
MEGRWSSVATAKEDGGESRPPLEKGGSDITAAAAATHGGASIRRLHERKHERGGGPQGWPEWPTPTRRAAHHTYNIGPSMSVIDLGRRRPLVEVELCVPDRYLGLVQVSGLSNGLGRATRPYFRWIELTQSQPDTPIDETELYLSVVECDDKGHTCSLGWTPSGLRRRHTTAGGRDEAGSSRPISTPNESVELLRRDFQAMQTHILRVMEDHTLTQDQL